MELGVLERVVILDILPKEANYATLKIKQNLQMDLSFSEEELDEYGITFDGPNINWKSSSEKEISIGEKATDLIVESLKKLDEQKKLGEKHITLWEKFVGK